METFASIMLLVVIGFTFSAMCTGLAEIYGYITKSSDGCVNMLDNLVDDFHCSIPAAKIINGLCSVGFPVLLAVVVGLVYGGYPYITAGIAAVCFTGNVLMRKRSKY